MKTIVRHDNTGAGYVTFILFKTTDTVVFELPW